MLRKRARSAQKDQQMSQLASDGGSESCLQSNFSGQRQKTSSFFNVPGLFVGLTPKGVSDCDSVRSPTSPLDFMLFSNLTTSLRFLKPSLDCSGGGGGHHQKSWDCTKIGLGSIVDSLEDDNDDDHDHEDGDVKGKDGELPEKEKPIIPCSNSKTILFGSQVRRCALFCEAPKSLPKNYPIFPHANKMRPCSTNLLEKGGSSSSNVLFEIGECPLFETDPPSLKIQSFSLDSMRLGSEISKLSTRISDLNKLTPESTNPMVSTNELTRPLTPEEIELSEDYTCVISHGPNPKTTHIFGDCVLESLPEGIDSGNRKGSLENGVPCLEVPLPFGYPPNDFLSYCCYCNKKLEEGKDIYMYRGEKAFCSWECRMEEISMEEENEKSIHEAASGSEKGDEDLEKSMFFAI